MEDKAVTNGYRSVPPRGDVGAEQVESAIMQLVRLRRITLPAVTVREADALASRIRRALLLIE